MAFLHAQQIINFFSMAKVKVAKFWQSIAFEVGSQDSLINWQQSDLSHFKMVILEARKKYSVTFQIVEIMHNFFLTLLKIWSLGWPVLYEVVNFDFSIFEEI
jgi:hypothetical protein